MKLKTTCTGCLNLSGGECSSKKRVFLDNDGYSTDGYCRIKHFKPNQVIQEDKLAILVIIENFDKDYVSKVLSDISEASNKDRFIEDLWLIIPNKLFDKAAELWPILNKHSSKLRCKNNIKCFTDDNIDPKKSIFDELDNINSQWIFVYNPHEICITEDNKISQWIKQIKTSLKKNKGIVGFYINEYKPLSIVLNKFAFKEMNQNIDVLWLNKVQGFRNSEEICPKLI